LGCGTTTGDVAAQAVKFSAQASSSARVTPQSIDVCIADSFRRGGPAALEQAIVLGLHLGGDAVLGGQGRTPGTHAGGLAGTVAGHERARRDRKADAESERGAQGDHGITFDASTA
jgi:hypothetical protein